MATQRIGFTVPLEEFYNALLAERELAPRSRLIANHVAALLPEVAVLIYAIEDQAEPLWNPKAVNGDIGVEIIGVGIDLSSQGTRVPSPWKPWYALTLMKAG